MKKSEILSLLIKQTSPSVSQLENENRSLRSKNRVAYAGLIGLTALTVLFGYQTHKTGKKLNDCIQEKKSLQETASYFQHDAAKLSEQNLALRDYANGAEMLANSIKYYPDDPDSLTDLPDNALESAAEESEKMNIINREKHEQTLKLLGVDTNLLYRVQRGPKLPE